MKKPDGSKKVLLVDHTEGQCRAIVGFKDGDPGAAFMCGEPVLRGSWCAYHHSQMHAGPVSQYASSSLHVRLHRPYLGLMISSAFSCGAPDGGVPRRRG